MSREDIQKLLGGYATDTLSEAERRELLEAALEDQELFDALAKEQALREVLQDPAARRQLIAALQPVRETFAARVWSWLQRPATLAMAGGLAVLLIVGGVILLRTKPPMRQETMVADAIAPRQPAPLASAAPAIIQQPLLRRKPARQAPVPAPATEQVAKQMAEQVVESAPPAPPAPPPAPTVIPAAGQNVASPPAPAFEARRIASLHTFARAKAAASALAGNLPLDYHLLRGNPDGTYTPAAAGTVFHTGDSVRLQIQPPTAGYLYLYQRQTDGGMNLVAGQPVESAHPYVLPASGGLASDKPGQMELMLVLAPQEQSAMRFQSSDSGAPAGAPSQAVRKITLEFR